ncbi:MAG: glutathione peroxidase [Sphingomonas bacterium]|nr:glutathione peroxidase [Sphingomonas bacterium]
MTSIYDFSADRLDGTAQSLAEYRGKAMLIVNTASRCGFTPQYEGLEALHRRLQAQGLAVLGFPCNQFGAQEPGDATEIANFCAITYDVGFPMFARIEVNGAGTHPLYRYLKAEARGLFDTQRIKWNFTKFLIDRDGKVIRRYPPTAKPETLRPAIEALL